MSSNNVRGTLKYVVRHVAKAFGLAAYEVEEVLFEEPNLSLVSAFLGADGPATLLVYEQPGVEGEGDEPPARQLYLATAESDRFVERGLLVVKLRDEALTEESIAGAVHCAVIRGSPVKTLLATLSQVYLPALADASSWAATLSEEGRHEFSTSLGRFVSTLDGAVSSLEGGVELAKPEPKYDVENKQPAFARAASQPEVVEHFERLIDSWCGKVEVLLAEDDESRAAATEESGPATELELWRARMAKFNSITEQLRGRECRALDVIANEWRRAADRARGGAQGARRGRVHPRPLPRRLPLGQAARAPRRLGAEGAVRAAAAPPRDRRPRRQQGRRRRRVQLPVLQVAEARRPPLCLRRRPPHRRPAGAVDPEGGVPADDEGLGDSRITESAN